tara:strand:- start:197 stop:586 length:390 start_codon:yes stop_codon:yes gene_type:complete
MNSTLLKAFNNQLNSFVTELIKTYPQEYNFKVFKNTICLIQKVNPRKVLLLFIEYITPYKDKLLNRDESFFLDENYTSIVQKTDNQENAWKLINQLKLYWKDTNNNNKDIIWKYFHQLITLATLATKSS